MQQIKKKLYAAPRVKSVKFQVEQGFQSSPNFEPEACIMTSNNSLEGWSRLDPDPHWLDESGTEGSNE